MVAGAAPVPARRQAGADDAGRGFDTPAFARRLEAAGVERAQAEAHAGAVRDAEAEATGADLAAGVGEMRAALAAP